jgi:alanine racemase
MIPYHLAELHINLDAIANNLALIRQRVDHKTKIMAVLKADAYGHGALPIAAFLSSLGIHDFAVAHIFEAISLRKQGVRGRILVLQPHFQVKAQDYIDYQLECTINSSFDIAYLSQNPPSQPLNTHLMLDTGMGREGCHHEEAFPLLESIQSTTFLTLKGIATHFATADSNLSYALEQWHTFHSLLAQLPPRLLDSLECHACNSGGILNLPQAHLDLVRPGILLFGQYEGLGKPEEQKPAMSTWGRVTQVKFLPKGHPIGYGCTFIMPQSGDVALVSIGYADGLLRRNHFGGKIRIGTQLFPIVGAINMDQLTVLLGNNHHVQPGDQVMIFGDDPELSLSRNAAALGTITYERCCQLGSRLPKQYLQGGRPLKLYL